MASVNEFHLRID